MIGVARVGVLSIVISLLFTSPAIGQAVDAKPVTTVLTTGGQKLYEQSIDYKFDHQEAVYIEGLGSLPPSGRLRYLSNELSVKFQTPDLREVLYKTQPPPSGSFVNYEFPDPSMDFPKGWRVGQWKRRDSFQGVAPSVINQMGFDCRAYTENDVYFLETPYTYLLKAKLPSYVSAQAALLVSQPFDKTADTFSFHVQVASRVRRLKDPDWSANGVDQQIDQQTKHAADDLVNSFIALLNRERGR